MPFGSVKPVWGNPTPETYKSEMATLPCVGIARTAGLKLREMLKRPGARLVRANVENGWRPVQITVGEIKGRTDDFVVVGGHQDSWPGPQATDNAAGNACILELARVFQQHRDKLRRGLVCGFWTGARDRHHDRLVLVRRPQLGPAARARGRLSADRPARLRRHDALGAASNTELKRFHQGVEKRILGSRPAAWRRAVKNGDASSSASACRCWRPRAPSPRRS